MVMSETLSFRRGIPWLKISSSPLFRLDSKTDGIYVCQDMKIVFANSGKRIAYNGGEFKIVESGVRQDRTPYVVLDPENDELAERMRAEIRNHGNLTIRVGGRMRLVLGDDEYVISR